MNLDLQFERKPDGKAPLIIRLLLKTRIIKTERQAQYAVIALVAIIFIAAASLMISALSEPELVPLEFTR